MIVIITNTISNNSSMNYKFQKTEIYNVNHINEKFIFDPSDDELNKNIRISEYLLRALKQDMINSGIYSCISNINRAIKNGVLDAHTNFTYITRSNRFNSDYYNCKMNNLLKNNKNIYEKKIYEYDNISYVEYTYDHFSKSIIRTEFYGDYDQIMRRELSDYEDNQSYYKIGDVVKLKHKFLWTKTDTMIILSVPDSKYPFMSNTYDCAFKTKDGNYELIDGYAVHYNDIDCLLYNDTALAKELMKKYQYYSE